MSDRKNVWTEKEYLQSLLACQKHELLQAVSIGY